MDETPRPVRVPAEVPAYAQKHHVYDLVETLVTSLLIETPEDPISFLLRLLKKPNLNVPRIIVLGPPAVENNDMGKRLCAELGSVHVTADSLLQQKTHQEVSSETWTSLIRDRLSRKDCLTQGWVLEGFPQTRVQARSLQQVGVLPDHVVILKAPAVLGNNYQDPLTGDDSLPVPDEEQLLVSRQRYRNEVSGLSYAYRHSLKVINTDQPHEHVYQEVLAFVSTRASREPHIPRILLLGPPGSGKKLQAKMLFDRYNIVHVCCGQVLKAIAADGSTLGGTVRRYLENNQPIPDRVVQQALFQRLSRLDCLSRGVVLTGYPRTQEQALSLLESNYAPSSVFILDIQEDVAMERVCLCSVDPLTGDRYHALSGPALAPAVRSRLQTHPRDSQAEVKRRLVRYWSHISSLQTVFPGAIHVNAGQAPFIVFETLERGLIKETKKTNTNNSNSSFNTQQYNAHAHTNNTQ